ncbi:MAG: hypothetical protein ACI97B_003749 [Verrucomicrobiales bacterium]|jgi:hypothetical protein
MKKYMVLMFLLVGLAPCLAQTEAQLNQWLKRFPAADANKDGQLTAQEAIAYRQKVQGAERRTRAGVPTAFKVDPGWDASRFPDHAVCYKTPEEIQAVNVKVHGAKALLQVAKPSGEGLRIVGTGHSFMAPGYRTFPKICEAAGIEQTLLTHTGGGITGSARYKWEQENGIFQFDGKPRPKLLAAIATGEWDAMMWGPYYQDRPAYYACWIGFCLKYNPEMMFYLSDAWPQLGQLDTPPKSEADLSAETWQRLGREKHAGYVTLLGALNAKYPGKVRVLPTSEAMVRATQRYYRGELPGVEGINQSLGGETYSLWRDQLGHLGPWFDRLEGYVFYATVYRRSPTLIDSPIAFVPDGRERKLKAPSAELDRIFREIAWEAVLSNSLSGVVDADGDGVGD